MTKDDLPPIPIPLAQRWRDARLRLIPAVVFCAALAGVVACWRHYVAAPTMVGQGEPVMAEVSSYKAGVLSELHVARFQHVKAGDPVGTVLVADPKLLASSLAVIQSEIELLRANMKPIASQQRNAMDYAQLRLDWMSHRAKLASARVDLQLALAERQRIEQLFKDRIVSQRAFDQAKASEQRLQSEVDELSSLVAEGERCFKELALTNAVEISKVSAEPQLAAIAVQEAKLKLTEAELSPITLKAPMDGIVSAVLHRSGESIVAGQPIVSIASLAPVRIVGYLRPPVPEQPAVGMRVQVRTHGLPARVGWARIEEVGSQMEPIPSSVLGPVKLASAEVALPVSVSVPPNLAIRPGELVDLTLMPSAN